MRRFLQPKCIKLDDDIRWISVLISDTGMSLLEAVGLAKTDIVLNHPHPQVVIQPDSWRGRRVETIRRLTDEAKLYLGLSIEYAGVKKSIVHVHHPMAGLLSMKRFLRDDRPQDLHYLLLIFGESAVIEERVRNNGAFL